MRNVMIPMALVASIALGSTAFATPQPAAAKPVPMASAAATKAAPGKTAVNGKQQACAKTWQGQKKHAGTRAAFMKSCVAKG
ncbi:MAG: hypothetical protein EPO51_24515 [Phenylobacterium sp.]|uniref:hypothetical protein n=1 Tax=Phenylobacterium sp. TaxID=1871053 RepID=UPI001205B342|nr:hypothetical protein [Phenylobacterium sp.]TAJ68709.1 MAG: hypothetical protein EPO51_24515 [Phenylobacterium sp.]